MIGCVSVDRFQCENIIVDPLHQIQPNSLTHVVARFESQAKSSSEHLFRIVRELTGAQLLCAFVVSEELREYSECAVSLVVNLGASFAFRPYKCNEALFLKLSIDELSQKNVANRYKPHAVQKSLIGQIMEVDGKQSSVFHCTTSNQLIPFNVFVKMSKQSNSYPDENSTSSQRIAVVVTPRTQVLFESSHGVFSRPFCISHKHTDELFQLLDITLTSHLKSMAESALFVDKLASAKPILNCAVSSILLVGQSGAGRTTIAHALARHCGVEIVSVTSANVFSQGFRSAPSVLCRCMNTALALSQSSPSHSPSSSRSRSSPGRDGGGGGCVLLLDDLHNLVPSAVLEESGREAHAAITQVHRPRFPKTLVVNI